MCAPPAQAKAVEPPPSTHVQRRELYPLPGVYASEPHQWWAPSRFLGRPFPWVLGIGIMLTYTVLCFTPAVTELSTFCWVYVPLQAFFLLWRAITYSRARWFYFTLDYCYVVNVLILVILLDQPGSSDAAQHRYQGLAVATTISLLGPVGLSGLFMRMGMLVHHPEPMSSWWIHIGAAWLSYPLRWKLNLLATPEALSFWDLVGFAVFRIYIPWVVCYTFFILVKHQLPFGLANHDTFCEDFMGRFCGIGAKLQFLCAHTLLTCSTIMLSSWVIASQTSHGLFLAALTLSTIWFGSQFYSDCNKLVKLEGKAD